MPKTPPPAEDTAIARAVETYTALLRDQVEAAQGWPERFRFPTPKTAAETQGLKLFCEAIEQETGVAVAVSLV